MEKYTGKIAFNELKSLNDDNHLMFIGLSLNDGDVQTIQEIEDYFNENELFPVHRTIKGMRRVTGNVLGDSGRMDWVIDIEPLNPEKADIKQPINPLVRMRMSEMGVKWVSDFVDNYAEDYSE